MYTTGWKQIHEMTLPASYEVSLDAAYCAVQDNSVCSLRIKIPRRAVFLNRRALASIIPGRETFS